MAELESSNLLRVETTARGDENDDEITITTSPLRPDLLIPQPNPPPLSAWRSLPPLVEVRNTEERGLGLFALQDIEPGTLLIFEEPLLVVPREMWDPLNKLVRGMNNEDWERFKALCRTKRESTESTNRAILFSNGFRMPDDAGTAVFDVGSRANHSCVPNSVFAVVRAGGQGEGEEGWRLMIYNTFALMDGEEVTVDYGHSRVGLERGYGFVCSCGGCSEGESDDEEDTEELGVERKMGKWRKLKGFLKRVVGKK
ncbi:hypothetical protein B0J14DRAFT_486954 [Halenospora varia]|nr:hypothetical protein B0J14DRAFT_486954 [Halenospora varia]